VLSEDLPRAVHAWPTVVCVNRGDDDSSTVGRTLEQSYDATVTTALPSVAALLCALSVVFVATDTLALDGTSRVVAVGLAAALVVVLGVLALVLRRRRVPDEAGQPITAALLVAAAAHPVVVMTLTDEPRQTTALLVVAVGAGAALLSLRWLVGTLYLLWGGWTASALLVGPSREWLHYAVGLALATALALVVTRVRRQSRRELVRARAAVEAAAVRDQLTGLANRRGLAMVGAQIVEHARRQGDAAHCIFLDISGLRAVNDQAGQDAGDQVVVAVAEALREVTRATDVVARWGGDEFCVVGPGPGMAPLELERRVRQTVLLHPPVSPDIWPVRISAGGSMLAPWDSGTLETLLGSADQEMHLRRSLRRENTRPTARPASAD
jgi:diguanylate cyclase (GGDEF)-like protein